MKFILSLLTIAFFSALCLANVTKDNQYLLNHEDITAQKVQLGTLLNQTQGLLVAHYSYAVQGGSSAADINLLTDLADSKSYAKLPANAIVTNAWLDSITQPGSTSVATKIAVKVKAAGDLFAAGSTTTTYRVGQTAGVPIKGTSTTWIKIGSAGSSTVKATISLGPVNAGKFNVYIEYVLGNTTN